jgi:hypothetical protein
MVTLMTNVSPETRVVLIMLGGSIATMAVLVGELTTTDTVEVTIKVDRIIAIMKIQLIFSILLSMSCSPFSI